MASVNKKVIYKYNQKYVLGISTSYNHEIGLGDCYTHRTKQWMPLPNEHM